MSAHLRAQWRKIAAGGRSRGMGYEDLWRANEPLFTVVGDLPATIGPGNVFVARQKMSYAEALNPVAFVNDLMAQAHRALGDVYLRPGTKITTLYLLAEGRGRDGLNAGGANWVVGQTPVGGRQFQPTSVSIRGDYRTYEPNPRLLHAMMYSSGEEARKWIGENLAGVVTDEEMFADLAQKVTVYRGISLGLHDDPWSAVKGDGADVGSSWTASLNTAKAIAERGRAGFTSGAQVLGDTYRIDPTRDRPPGNYLPTVLRAEVTLMPPEQGGPAPYRPWTIDYASEAEIDIPRGTEIILNGYLQAAKVVHGTEDEYGLRELVTWSWASSWRGGNVRRTAAKPGPSQQFLDQLVQILTKGLPDAAMNTTGSRAVHRGSVAISEIGRMWSPEYDSPVDGTERDVRQTDAAQGRPHYLDDLAAQIRQHPQVTPVEILAPPPGEDEYQFMDGHHRYFAAKMAGLGYLLANMHFPVMVDGLPEWPTFDPAILERH